MIFGTPSQTLPIVLHRLVQRPGDDNVWEDVDIGSFKEIVKLCQGRTILPGSIGQGFDRHWLITFDDGHISDFELAFPLLVESDCRAVFFVVTDFIGTDGYMNWGHIKELARNGMCIGSHSKSHKRLSELNNYDLDQELEISKDLIENKLGLEIQNFSFPYGSSSERAVRKARDCGYKYLHGSKHGFLGDNALILPRNSINGFMSIEQIEKTLFPNYFKIIQWGLEDLLKDLAKRTLGIGSYSTLRNRIFMK